MTIGCRALVAMLGVVLGAASCWSPDREFGAQCDVTEDCSRGDACISGRCVPARQPGDAGERCGNALALGVVSPGAAPLVRETQLSGAQPEHEAGCGLEVIADVVFELDVDERTPLRIRAEGVRDVALSLRPFEADTCGEEVADGCSTTNELLLEDLAPGRWAVIVSDVDIVDDAVVGGVDQQVRLVVEPIDCPLGYLPFGDDQCAGFRTVPANAVPRSQALLTALPDGRAVLSGGLDADGTMADTAEVFDPMTETWSFLSTRQRRPNHSAVLLGGSFVMAGGGPGPEVLRQERGGDVIYPLDFSSSDRHTGDFDTETELLAAGLPSGTMAVVTNYSGYLLQVMRPTLSCIAGGCLDPEAVCVASEGPGSDPFIDGICLCPAGPCLGDPVLGELGEIGGEHPQGAADRARPLVGAMRGGREVAFLHDSARIYELDVDAAFWRNMPVAGREEVALVPSDRGVLVVGGREDGVASALMEAVDFATRSPTATALLRHARAGHALARLHDGRILVLGGVGPDEQPLDSVELIDSSTAIPSVSRMPRLPEPLASVRAAALADGRVLIVGVGAGDDGLMTSTLLFHLVPRGRTAPPPLEQTCGVVVPITNNAPSEGTPAASIAETTVGEHDRYRDPSCGRTFDVEGPERLFSFTLQAAASFRARTDLHRTAFVLWRGTCSDHDTLGCVVTSAEDDGLGTTMLAPTLEPGAYTLVVEAHDDESSTGTKFGLTTWLGEVESCPPGPEDPGDDSPDGARALEIITDWGYPDIAEWEGASGTLCRDDVDHVIVQRWSADSWLGLTNASRELSTLAPAIIDDDATLAAGAPVYQFGDPRPFGDGAGPPGIFLATLAVGAQDALVHHWSLMHAPATCPPDQLDSLAQVLDDGANPSRRALLPPSGIMDRCLTSDLDVDVTIAALPQDRDAIVALDGDWGVDVQLFALAAPDAPLEAAIGEPISRGSIAVMPAGTAPYLALKASTAFTGGAFYRLMVTSSDAGEACTTATPLPDSGTIDFDSDLYPARLDPEELGDCTGFPAPGSEMVASLSLREGDRLDASLDPTDGGDVSLYLLTSCLVGAPVCVTGADEGYAGDAEVISYTHSGLEQTLYLVSDSYETAPYTARLTWSVTRAGQ
ncbi:MAG: hypothetical protein A2138_23235 [Deltaproteobacteria bacterium RBG_16_71_12]|nr:MAG: hypothetical protein A2138_23235 [Deltaproteobacteria bacterium RBG_16_71_12]